MIFLEREDRLRLRAIALEDDRQRLGERRQRRVDDLLRGCRARAPPCGRRRGKSVNEGRTPLAGLAGRPRGGAGSDVAMTTSDTPRAESAQGAVYQESTIRNYGIQE